MKKYMVERVLKEKLKEIYEKNEIIKEVDFNTAIDIEKSGNFFLNRQEKFLEFLFQPYESIDIKDYSLVLGNIQTDEMGIKMIPTFNDNTNNLIKRTLMIIKKSIKKNDIDIIFLKFEMNESSSFYFNICNESYYRLIEQMKIKQLQYKADLFYDSGSECVVNYFHNNSLTIRKQINGIFDLSNSKKISFEKKTIDFILNINKGIVNLENKKYKVPFFDFNQDDDLYISLQNNVNLDMNTTLKIKKVVFARTVGYIYLKPFKIQTKKAQVYFAYNGNPIVQYYAANEKQWIDLLEGDSVVANKEIQFRIKMRAGDKLYKLLIYS